MWVPRKLQLVNFQTHVNTEYEFKKGKVTLFQGLNYDNNLRSNGSGKSTILEGISYAVLGSGLKKGVDSDLIRNGENSAFIWFELENSRNNYLLVIEREILLKSTSKLSIWLNGEDQKKKFATIGDGNNLILQLIGINRKDLLNYYLISKEKYVSYYSSSDTDKKEVISRFSKSDRIDGIEGIIQGKLDEFAKVNIELERGKLKIETQIETYNDQIEEERNTDREKLKTDQILQYNDQIVKNDYAIFDKNHTIEQLEGNNFILNNHNVRYNRFIDEYDRQIELLKSVDYSKELSAIDGKESNFKKEEDKIRLQKQELEKEVDESNQFLREIETGLKGLIQCPKCSHEFIPDEDFDAGMARENKDLFEVGIKELNKNIEGIKVILQKSKLKYQEFEKEREVFRNKIKEFNNKKNDIQIKINRCKTSVKNVENKIKNNNFEVNTENVNIKNLINTIEKTKVLILQLQNQKIEDEIIKIQTKIAGLNAEKIEIEELIKENGEERFKHEQWIYNFKKFKSFLANKSIKSIESLSNLTLKRMNSALQVQLEGYGLLKSGELREKITASILRDGFNEGSFFKLSGGEKGDIEIATISALQQLINFNTESGGLDLLFVDEILESIDGIGLAEVAKAASKLNKTIGLITHVSIPSDDHYEIVTIEKRNKISKIL
jgi:DNA repair protein SbcC/Rad50